MDGRKEQGVTTVERRPGPFDVLEASSVMPKPPGVYIYPSVDFRRRFKPVPPPLSDIERARLLAMSAACRYKRLRALAGIDD